MINKLKDNFLRNHNAYKNDVKKFVDYLTNLNPSSPFNNEFTIRGMTVEVILNCLEYYVDNETIKKKEPARKFVSAIGQLMEYLFESDPKLINETLRKQLGAPSNRSDSYNRICNEKIDSLNLEEKESLDALRLETVKILCDKCNESISKFISATVYERIQFRNAASALCIKLILYIGITYGVARTLKITDFDTDINILTINGYNVTLPLNLSQQFRSYIKKIQEYDFDTTPEYLFFGTDGSQWGDKTSASGITNFLINQLDTVNKNIDIKSGITPLVKYAITQLILKGVNDGDISDITGASDVIIEDCHDINDQERYSYLNSKLLNTDFYILDNSKYFEEHK